HRRLHATRSIALHPPVFCERKAIQKFGEVLHHVIPFKLSMNKHIETDAFLLMNALRNCLLEKSLVLFRRFMPVLRSGTMFPNLGGLREGTDCCGRQKWKPKFLALEWSPLS